MGPAASAPLTTKVTPSTPHMTTVPSHTITSTGSTYAPTTRIAGPHERDAPPPVNRRSARSRPASPLTTQGRTTPAVICRPTPTDPSTTTPTTLVPMLSRASITRGSPASTRAPRSY